MDRKKVNVTELSDDVCRDIERTRAETRRISRHKS